MSDSNEQAAFVAPDPADLAPLFPGYDIQGLIAVGGMGAVYRAVQKSLDRTVALKILPMEFSKDSAFCAGFEAEAKAMARLNHPNLIGVYDFGEVNGMLFIIMEYVPGQSVYHSAYGIAVDQSEVIRLMSAICDGLAHAHENGIIHRDIKPSNILLDLNLQPKIGDFGLARPMDRKIEEGEEIFGTPHYTAPEVVDSPHSVDYRADIFSVGVMLHELLTGILPAQDPRPASTIIRCDPRFDTIIRRATQPLAAARYSSAAQISKELQAIGSSLGQRPLPTQAVAVPRRPQSRRNYSAGPKQSSGSSTVVWLLVGAAAAIAAYTFLLKKPEPPAPPTAVAPTSEPETSVEKPVSKKPVAPDAPVPKSTQSNANQTAFGSTAPPQEVVQDPTSVAPDVTPTATTIAPKADVPGFFGRARKIMQDRTKSSLSAYRSNLSANVADFNRGLGLQVRKMKLSGASMDKSLETQLEELKKPGAKIPETLPSSLAAVPGIETLVDEHKQRQIGIDDTLRQSLAPHSSTYILGLQKEIERRKAENDTGAVTLIEEEIAKTKDSPQYFSNLMLGLDPAADQ